MSTWAAWSPVAIARAEEARQALATAELAPEAEPIAGGWMAFNAVGSWMNQACGMGLDGPVSEEALDRLVAFYTERGVEPRLELCPFAHPTLTQGLAARGFRLRAFENVLAWIAEDARVAPRALVPLGWPEGLDVDIVPRDDPALVDRYCALSTSGFRPPDRPISPVELDSARRVVQHPRTTAWVARIGDDEVGAGAMEVAGEVMALFGVSVLPKWRRRGVQQALIAQRLAHGVALGARLAVIHSEPGIPTERNAMRLGFRVAYTKVVMVCPKPGLAVSV